MTPSHFSLIFADYTWTGMIALGLCSKSSTSDRFREFLLGEYSVFLVIDRGKKE